MTFKTGAEQLFFWTASRSWFSLSITTWKVSKYGVVSGPYFPAFGVNTSYLSVFSPSAGKYRPEITPYLNSFRLVYILDYFKIDFFVCSIWNEWSMFCFQQDQMEKICFKVISQNISSFSTKENFQSKIIFSI